MSTYLPGERRLPPRGKAHGPITKVRANRRVAGTVEFVRVTHSQRGADGIHREGGGRIGVPRVIAAPSATTVPVVPPIPISMWLFGLTLALLVTFKLPLIVSYLAALDRMVELCRLADHQEKLLIDEVTEWTVIVTSPGRSGRARRDR